MATHGTARSATDGPALRGLRGERHLVPALEPLMTLHLELAKPVVMANGISGARVFEGIIAGTARGERTRASVSAHSGCIDTVVREDGWCDVELRLLLATDDHGLISVRSTGVVDVGPSVRPRMAVRFESVHGDHAWLNRVQAVAIGERRCDEITYQVFAIS